jgi:hypothetical protein
MNLIVRNSINQCRKLYSPLPNTERIEERGANKVLHRELPLRFFTAVVALGMLAFAQPGHSEEKTRGEMNASKTAKFSPADEAARSAAIAKETRDKNEAVEHARDRKMRAISRGICTGC